MPGPITIYSARKVVTMNPSNPDATAVAVRDGLILGAGSVDDLAGWGRYTLDDTFRDHVLVPGMIEGHSHAMEGGAWEFPYVGYFDRRRPDGALGEGARTLDEVLTRLSAAEAAIADPTEPLCAWGLDPIYFPGERLVATHLDRVSTTRPIFVFHANAHLATVNTALMREAGIDAGCSTEGVARDHDGQPNGELQELPAMALAGRPFRMMMRGLSSEDGIWRFGQAANRAGLTTITELAGAALAQPEAARTWNRIVRDPAFPARVVMYSRPDFPGAPSDHDELVARVRDLERQNSPRMRYGGVKIVLDGSIQGGTALISPPGYYAMPDHGVFLHEEAEFNRLVRRLHRERIQLYVHCNGDVPVDRFMDAVEDALLESPWLDHRHTVQHCQLATRAQYRRMARLGMCANIFSNHIWYWGDQHYEFTVGPERAQRMDACGTAGVEGVRYSIHSDASVTPLGHLHTMWCAVNRLTSKGRVLGAEERISAYDALRACTIDAAFLLRMDRELGSIEAGKWADFTVLDESPLDVDPAAIRDIRVWGTVLAGDVFPAAAPATVRGAVPA